VLRSVLPSMQGLTVAAVGCADMGSAVHKESSALMAVLVAESLKRPTQFGQRVRCWRCCRFFKRGCGAAMPMA
jgi:hypothetical protein